MSPCWHRFGPDPTAPPRLCSKCVRIGARGVARRRDNKCLALFRAKRRAASVTSFDIAKRRQPAASRGTGNPDSRSCCGQCRATNQGGVVYIQGGRCYVVYPMRMPGSRQAGAGMQDEVVRGRMNRRRIRSIALAAGTFRLARRGDVHRRPRRPPARKAETLRVGISWGIDLENTTRPRPDSSEQLHGARSNMDPSGGRSPRSMPKGKHPATGPGGILRKPARWHQGHGFVTLRKGGVTFHKKRQRDLTGPAASSPRTP